MKKLILLLALSCSQFFTHAQDNLVVVNNPNGDDFIQGRINLKVKPEFREYFSELKNTISGFEALEIAGLRRKFPQRKPLEKQYNDSGRKLPDLSLIYELDYNAEQDVFKTSEQLLSSGYFDYAEPHYVSYPMFTPNDPKVAQYNPYHLTTMHLYEAWDVTQGDTNIVIGYTDTSFDVYHPDLRGNVKLNWSDLPDGVDNDGDFKTDNWRGWDLVDNDSILFINNEIHGTTVLAVGSATTDNDTGIAGAGFNCKYIPVKVANSSQVITQGYEGVVYAIDKGAKIVNCSWGNTTFNQLAQDVINDAALVNDVVIVASAGNVDSENYYYPASYEYVLSVTGVDANDLVDPSSGTPFTHNDSVDVSAPGFDVYTTATYNGGSVYQPPTGGTSIAAPLVAGVAGLVWTQFPNLTALEVIERIKCTADNIDAVPGNEIYAGLIGTGRVNAFAAVSTNNQCGLVDIANTKEEQGIIIYPNPAQDVLNVVIKNELEILYSEFRISNGVGELVTLSVVEGHQSSINISSLSAGIYYCTLKTDKAFFSKKIVVVK
jgi:serine protease